MYLAEATLAFKLLSIVERIHKSPEKELKELGITYGNYISLVILHDQEGITQAGLSERQHKDRNVTGQTIDKLEKKHLVQRVRDGEDRRIYKLYLTDQGRRVVEDYWDIMMRGEREQLQKLTVREQEQLQELLVKMMEQAPQ